MVNKYTMNETKQQAFCSVLLYYRQREREREQSSSSSSLHHGVGGMAVLESPAGAAAPGPTTAEGCTMIRRVVVVELRHGVRPRCRRPASTKAGEDVSEEAADGAPVRGSRLPGPPGDPAGRAGAAAVEPAVHLRVHHRQLALLRPPPAREPPHREPAAGEPPDGEPDRRLLLLPGCPSVGARGARGGVGGHLVAADGAGVAYREPWQDTVGVVDVRARHLPGLSPELEGLLADGAVRVGGDVGGPDGHHGHGLDGGFGRRGRVAGARGGEPARLDLRELV